MSTHLFFYAIIWWLRKKVVNLQQEVIKIHKNMTREETISAFKKAIENKKSALKRTEERWIQEGIKGKVVAL